MDGNTATNIMPRVVDARVIEVLHGNCWVLSTFHRPIIHSCLLRYVPVLSCLRVEATRYARSTHNLTFLVSESVHFLLPCESSRFVRCVWDLYQFLYRSSRWQLYRVAIPENKTRACGCTGASPTPNTRDNARLLVRIIRCTEVAGECQVFTTPVCRAHQWLQTSITWRLA